MGYLNPHSNSGALYFLGDAQNIGTIAAACAFKLRFDEAIEQIVVNTIYHV